MCLAGESVTSSAFGTFLTMNSPASGERRGVLVAHEDERRDGDRGKDPRGVVGDHPEHPSGEDVGPIRRHEPGGEVELPRVSLPENDDLWVERWAEPLK